MTKRHRRLKFIETEIIKEKRAHMYSNNINIHTRIYIYILPV